MKKYTALETWLWENLKPGESDSVHQTYDNIIWQGDGRLPVINLPQNLRDIAHFADEALIQGIVAYVRDAADVLDIGPGDGWPILRIAPYVRMVTGIEPSSRRLEVCRTNAERLRLTNVRFHEMSATALNFADNSFDAVVAASSIEQTANPFQSLAEVFRVLKPGGRFWVMFESPDVEMSTPIRETVTLREHPDGSLGWHYSLKHRSPPWERNYLVEFPSVPEVVSQFEQARAVIAQSGSDPAQVPEVGSALLQALIGHVQRCSYYELEHFTSDTMKQTLEEIGFTGVNPSYSPAKLARLLWPHLHISSMSDEQLRDLAQALGQMSIGLPAPLDQGQPVLATKPAPTS